MSGKPPPPVYKLSSGVCSPPSQPAPSYTYVPAPVVMPMPVPMPTYPTHPPPPRYPEAVRPPQPTYVTNYIYQQAPIPDPVRVVEIIDWAQATSTTAASLTHKAFVAGKEDSSPLWVIRAYHNGDCVIGKYSVKNRTAYIPYGGKEVRVHEFEILLTQPHAVRWLESSNGQVPVGAIAAGSTQHGEPLYIARIRYQKPIMGRNLDIRYSSSIQVRRCPSIIPGKVHPSHGCCYISYKGSEISRRNYEVLCNIID